MNLFLQEISIFILINNLFSSCQLLASFNLTQHVFIPTHTQGLTPDLVITSASTSLNIILSHAVNTTSDHFQIFSRCYIMPNPLTPPTTFTFSRINSISIYDFTSDLKASKLITDPSSTHPDLMSSYFSTLRLLLDKHALPSPKHLHALMPIIG